MSKYFTTQDEEGNTIRALKRDVSLMFGKDGGTYFFMKGVEGRTFSSEPIDDLIRKIEAKGE